jgi:hypothetical protein
MPLNLNAAGICDPALDHEIAQATRLQTTNPRSASCSTSCGCADAARRPIAISRDYE